MELVTFIIIAVLVLAAFAVVMRLVKAVFRIIIALVLIAVVVAAGFYVFSDVKNLAKGLEAGSKLLLLDFNGDIVGGAVVVTGEPVMLESVAKMNEYYHQKNYGAMLGNNFKMFVFGWGLFDGIQIFSFGEQNFTRGQMLEMLGSPKPRDVFASYQTTDSVLQQRIAAELSKQFPTDDYFKSMLFMIALGNLDKELLVKSILKGDVLVYPETISLKLVRILPESLVNKALEKAVQIGG